MKKKENHRGGFQQENPQSSGLVNTNKRCNGIILQLKPLLVV